MTYALLRLQGHLPLNPDHMAAVKPGLVVQHRGQLPDQHQLAGLRRRVDDEPAVSQMLALVLQQFLSAAVGMAVAVAFIRAIIRRRQTHARQLLGGHDPLDHPDPAARSRFVFAIVFMSQGVIQNFHAAKQVTTVAAQATHSKATSITARRRSPAARSASMKPIEELGDNGGGFFNANTAHPYENPNPLTSLLLSWLVVMIPFAFPFTFGKCGRVDATGLRWCSPRWPSCSCSPSCSSTRLRGHRQPQAQPRPASARRRPPPTSAATWRARRLASAWAARPSSATARHRHLGRRQTRPTRATRRSAGRCPLVNMMLGEVSPGGAGSGLYGKLILVLPAVFIAGLMVGRTPEYLGKKIQAREMKLVVIYILAVPAVIAGLRRRGDRRLQSALSSLSASGPHGLTEMVYAFASAANNNGSAFAGISANTQWYNTTLGLVHAGRPVHPIIPVLAIGGSLVRKQAVPATAGTFRTDTPLFLGLLLAVTVILVGLTYFPVVALGPIVEHLAGHF